MLGYVILKIDYDENGQSFSRYIYEAVLAFPETLNSTHFIHCQRAYGIKTSLNDDVFVVNGNLYAQQNHYGFVCAHVALRTVLDSILPEGDATYKQLASFAGSRNALYSENIESVLSGFGASFRKW